jgi:hypothetical protein
MPAPRRFLMAALVAVSTTTTTVLAQDPGITPTWPSSTPALHPVAATANTGLTIGKTARIAMAGGGLLLFSVLVDNGIQGESQERRGAVSNSVASIGNEFGNAKHLFPVLGAAWLAGAVLGSDRTKDVAGHALQAGLAAGMVASGLKFVTGRQRPNSRFDNDHFDWFKAGDTSFPSGHTALAFSLATALSNEFQGHWDDVGFYSLATLTGLSRINDNKHWFSDVLAGAAVGVLAGRWSTRVHRRIPVVATPSGVGFSFSF